MKEKASKIRKRIIDVMAKNGGHLASNLGVVELTIALHEVFNSPEDKLIFDTSHQTYAHKLLTGRSDRFDNIRKAGGLYGFAAPHESFHDHFYAGHGATSLSLALGCAKARDLTGGNEYIVPILGDAMLTCGLAYEALDNIPKNLKRFVIILNDNEMSIAKNVGAISEVLARLLNRPKSNKFYHEVANFLRKIPTFGDKLALKGKKLKESLKTLSGSDAPFFEHFNLAYVGPIDGHDIQEMIDVFTAVKDLDKPTIIHVRTIKGYGLDKAESAPIAYHGAQPFDPETGEFLPSKSQLTFPKVFGKHLLHIGEHHKNVIAISPATPVGTAMVPFMEKYPDRSIDVGIAEGHSVTFAGACAYQNKLKPILSVYSTFLQRGFDNIFHDVCIQNLPVIFAIDRAGISSGDGITHHGIYDIGFLAAMPNMVICQPRSGHLLKELLESALSYQKPTAIRYPNLPTTDEEQKVGTRPLGRGEVLAQGQDIAIIALGHMCETALLVREKLLAQGLNITVVDPIFIKPLDTKLLDQLLLTHTLIITLEEHVLIGGLGSLINSYVMRTGCRNTQVLNFGLPETPIHPGSYAAIMKDLGLDADSLAKSILETSSIEAQV